MTEPEKLIAKFNKKQYLVYQEQYFDNLRKHSELSIYEVTARMQIYLNIARLAQDLRLLDSYLKKYYEETKQNIDNELPTVDEMATEGEYAGSEIMRTKSGLMFYTVIPK